MDPARARPSRKLIVAFDIGTTFSSAAYKISDPGHASKIRYVTWHLNDSNPESARVPSTLYYDHNGEFRGILKGVDFQDSDALVKVKWWKLLLSPSDLPAVMKDQISMELPKGKTIIDVFADFMQYLLRSTKTTFESEKHEKLRWNSISESIELVLIHPNGWGGPQQAQLRNAAVKAGIVQDTPAGRSRVHFVTEGEASFSFYAAHTKAGRSLRPKERVLMINAGGGTIDISTYKVLSTGPLLVEELYEPKCLILGGELVTARAETMVREKWRDSRFDNPGDLERFSQKFDEDVKKAFSVSNSRANRHVKIGSSKDNDPSCGISRGRLTFTGAQVSGFFEPSIQSTVDAIRGNFKRRLPPNSFAFLAGGFVTSPWVSEQLQRRLSDLRFQFYKLDPPHTHGAVAAGAVFHYIYHFVKVRKDTEGAGKTEIGDLKGLVARQKADIQRLEQKLIGECGNRDDRIAKLEQGGARLEQDNVKLEQENAKLHGSLKEAVEAQARQAQSMQEWPKQTQELLDARTRSMQERLKKTEELLQARTAELSQAQNFLSKVDHLSEMEVLGIVQSLNENIFQLTASLTDAWERLRPSQATGRIEVDLTSQPHHSVLVKLARKRDLTGLTYLLQSYLCYQAVEMTSSWVRNRKPGELGSVYQHLSASEVQAISARWRSLTHSHLLPPPPQSASVEDMVKKKVEELVRELAGILNQTGSFPSLQQSSKFVRDTAFGGIKSMIETSQRLETAFMVDVASSDLSLLYGYPGAMFDKTKMTNEFGSDSACKPGKEGKIAGTTEVGVEKSICGQGETRRAETLLKVKVVLKKDLGDGK